MVSKKKTNNKYNLCEIEKKKKMNKEQQMAFIWLISERWKSLQKYLPFTLDYTKYLGPYSTEDCFSMRLKCRDKLGANVNQTGSCSGSPE